MKKKLSSEIKKNIRIVKDFPIKNIFFQDITSLADNPSLFKKIISELSQYIKDNKISKVAGIEARGFIFASASAFKCNLPLVLIRKKGKLPGSVYTQKYKLEYGFDEIQVHKNSINSDDKVLIIDDLVATGGTAIASIKLIKKFKPKEIFFYTIIDLKNLNGSNRIKQKVDFNYLYETNG